jgi:hypothetical protein
MPDEVKHTVNGYIVTRVHPGIVKIEGYAPCSDIQAREILGIAPMQRRLEQLERQWNAV